MSRCSDCPSYLSDPDVKGEILLQRPLNTPICGRYGHVLGREGQSAIDEENLLQYFAEECDSFGAPRPTHPASVNLRVAEPDDRLISDPTDATLGSCHGCANLVKDQAVMQELGWTLPLCKAKGTLVFSPAKDAKDCPWARPGMPSDDCGPVILRPQYMENFRFTSIKALEAMLHNGNVNIEPTTYATDLVVEAEDKADGIRAWRKIMSPYGDDKSVLLPIFDRAYFSEEEQRLIPTTGDSHHPELYVDYSNLLWKFATKSWTLDETMCLLSQPGLGKTEFTYWVAWLMQVPWRHVLVGPGTEPDDLFGKILAEGGSTYWQDGRFTMAWTAHAGILCLDEPNTGQDEVVIPLRSTTDSNKSLTIDAGIARTEQDVIKPRGKYTMQIWCMNPAHDFRNIGTRELAAADISRLSPSKVEFPPEPLERKIITERCLVVDEYELPVAILDDIMKVAKDLREASKQGEFPGTWGIREQIQVARMTAWFPFVEAYREAVLNFYEAEVEEHLITTCIAMYRSDGSFTP